VFARETSSNEGTDMTHIIVSLFGTLLLPVVMVAVLASIMGIKPESILTPLVGLFGAILKVVLDLVIVIVRAIGGVVMVAIAKKFNDR
jgi:hypothetical protein